MKGDGVPLSGSGKYVVSFYISFLVSCLYRHIYIV